MKETMSSRNIKRNLMSKRSVRTSFSFSCDGNSVRPFAVVWSLRAIISETTCDNWIFIWLDTLSMSWHDTILAIVEICPHLFIYFSARDKKEGEKEKETLTIGDVLFNWKENNSSRCGNSKDDVCWSCTETVEKRYFYNAPVLCICFSIYFIIRKEQPVNLVVLFDRNCKILFFLGVVGLVFFFMWCVFRTFVSCNWVDFVSFWRVIVKFSSRLVVISALR